MTFRVNGIIIGKKDFREADRLFTIYTREQGKMKVLGQGTRKLSSKLAGNLELFHAGAYTIAKGKQLDRIATVDIKNTYEPIKQHLERLAIASYGIEVFDQLVQWDQPDESLFLLLGDFLDTVRTVGEGRRIPVSRFFILKLSFLLGYQPAGKAWDDFATRFSKKSLADLSTLSFENASLHEVIQTFISQHCQYPLKSQEYYDHIAGTSRSLDLQKSSFSFNLEGNK